MKVSSSYRRPLFGLLLSICVGCPTEETATITEAVADVSPSDITSALDITINDTATIADTSDNDIESDIENSRADVEEEKVEDIETTGQDISRVSDDIPRSQCTIDSDCDGILDGLGQCDAAICEDGECVIDGQPVGTPCDDGNICTSNDGCTIEGCAGTPLDCPVSSQCEAATCNPTTGACESLDTTNEKCTDGNPCTTDDVCKNGLCVGIPAPCPTCTANADCVSFDDANQCNGSLACIAGECIADPASVPDCSVLQTTPCTSAVCVPESGACTVVTNPDGTSCENTSACSTNGFCAQGVCVGGEVDCEDNNPCTDDLCSETFGCINQPNNEAICDDGNQCTDGDNCNSGVCVGTPLLDCDDEEECTVDSCDLATGKCSNTPIEGDCDDGNACTAQDGCVSGQCIGAKIQCPSTACENTTCEPATGCVSVPIECDDDNECTSDVCNVATGLCKFTLEGDLCDSDIECGSPDPCNVGICNDCGVCEQIAVNCNDANPCTTDTCVSGVGCSFESTNEPCDDGDSCTEQDTCIDGSCTGTIELCGPGTQENPAVNCEAIADFDPAASSGTYWLILGTGPDLAYCDMSLAGGGWMRIGIASESQPQCNLAQGFGTPAEVADSDAPIAMLPSSAILDALWPNRQLLVRLPQGDFLFVSNQPGWTWPSIADGTINASNISNYQVAGGILGTTLAPIENSPQLPNFAGSPLLGGYVGSLLTPFIGIGATITGSYEQNEACEALSTFSGFYAGTLLAPALWNTPGTLWIR